MEWQSKTGRIGGQRQPKKLLEISRKKGIGVHRRNVCLLNFF